MDSPNFLPLADIEQLNFISLLVLSVLSAGVWVVLLTRKFQGRELIASRPTDEVPWGLIDVWIMMAIWFAGGLLGSLFCSYRPDDKTFQSLMSGIMILATTALGIGLLWFRYRSKATGRIFPSRLLRDLGIGVVAFVAVVPPIFWLMSFLVQIIPYKHETLEQIKDSPTAFVLLATYFSAALAAPVGEEFFFRFALQSWLQRLRFPDFPVHRFATIYGDFTPDNPTILASGGCQSPDSADLAIGDPTPLDSRALKLLPIVVSALLFAAMHIGQGPAPIVLFLLGLALGYMFYKTGSILTCIVLHACLNFYSLTWESLRAIEQSIAN